MSSFFSPYRHQFIRIGACVPHVAVTKPRRNAENVLGLLAAGDHARVALMVFPELCLSAYAIDDLFFQDAAFLGGGRPLVTLEGKLVLFLPADVEFLRENLGRFAHE